MEKKISKGLKKLDNVILWISNCDTKSSFVLTLLGIIVTIIFTSSIGAEMIEIFSCERAKSIDWQGVKYFTRIISVITFFLGVVTTVYFIYKTLNGRFDSKEYEENGLNIKSNIFFQTISKKTFEIFETETNGENDSVYLNDINSQIFINSKIAIKKFKNYNRSLISVLVTLGGLLLFIILK